MGWLSFWPFSVSQKFWQMWWTQFLFSKMIFRMAPIGSNITTKTFKNNYKHSLAIYNILSQNLGEHSKCKKFGISTKSENVNFNYFLTLWAHKPKHFLLWNFCSNSKDLVKMGPKDDFFVFLVIFWVSKNSANLMNWIFFKNDIQSGSQWNKYHNKDLQLIDISILWHLITF